MLKCLFTMGIGGETATTTPPPSVELNVSIDMFPYSFCLHYN